MNILALDLGTDTGWAVSSSAGVELGAWELATAKELRESKLSRFDRRLDPRMVALWNHLEELHRRIPLDWIFFEDVRFIAYAAAGQMWASFRGIVWAFAIHHRIPVDCLDTGKLKVFATGRGNADKAQMLAALRSKNPKLVLENPGLSDDAVDACHLLAWARSIKLLDQPAF